MSDQCIQKVQDFIKDKLHVHDEIEIKTAHWMGIQNGNRPMVATLKHIDEQKKLFEHASNLMDKHNGKGKNVLLTGSTTWRTSRRKKGNKRHFNEEQMSTPQTKLEMTVAKNKLMVNNQTYKKLITPPQAADILRLHVDEIEVAWKVKLIKGDTINEKDSEFISIAQKVCTMEEVRLGYRKMRIKYRDANTYNVCLQTQQPNGPVQSK